MKIPYFFKFFAKDTSAKTDKIIKKSYNPVYFDPSSYLGYVLTQDTDRIRPYVAMEFYRRNAAIATSVDWIAEALEQIKPVLEDEEGAHSDDHDVIELLLNPNGFQTWSEFIGEISRHYLLTHNAFLLASGNVSYVPSEIYVIKPQNVSIFADSRDDFPGNYSVGAGVGFGQYTREIRKREARFYSGNLKEIYQITGFSSHDDNLWGDSPLKAAALEARQQIQGRIHNLQLLNNGGRLSLIVNFKDENLIDEDELKERKERIQETLGGSNNAGSIAVVSAPEMDIEELGKTNKDMDYAELDRVASHAIYMRYKIPLPLVTPTAATYNNMRTAVEMLYDFAVLPHADTIFSALTKFLLPRFGLDTKQYRITYNPDSITALMERKIDQLKARKDIGIETINELRSLIPNREDLDGGDILYQPANLIPVGEDIDMPGDDIPRGPTVEPEEEERTQSDA